jgi:hypothetical protein
MPPHTSHEEALQADGPPAPAMLYFTFLERKSGALRAIYNGRFAFLREFPPDVALRVKLADPARDAAQIDREGVSVDALKSLSEEEKHKALFLHCASGLFLNGMRFLVRVVWLVRKRERLPRLYYRFRTQFFLGMYDTHEELAGLLQRDEENATEKAALEAKIAAEDQRLLVQWREILGRRFWALKPVAVFIGQLLSRHFAVVTVDAKSLEKTATNVASGGLFNTSGSFGKREGWRIERILVWLRPEAWLQLSEPQLWRWMILKFQEERREIFRQVGNSRHAEEIYASYVQKIIVFLSLYMEVEDQLSVFWLEKLLLNVEASAAQTPPASWLGKKEIFAMVEFFYGHGN